MKPAIGLAIMTVVLASIGSVVAITPVAAECRANTSASSGVRLSDGGTTESACARAREKWAGVVKQRYGARFTSWSAARNRLQGVKREGDFIKCSAQAIPCEPTVRAPPR
jgi:hypothetical protein